MTKGLARLSSFHTTDIAPRHSSILSHVGCMHGCTSIYLFLYYPISRAAPQYSRLQLHACVFPLFMSFLNRSLPQPEPHLDGETDLARWPFRLMEPISLSASWSISDANAFTYCSKRSGSLWRAVQHRFFCSTSCVGDAGWMRLRASPRDGWMEGMGPVGISEGYATNQSKRIPTSSLYLFCKTVTVKLNKLTY